MRGSVPFGLSGRAATALSAAALSAGALLLAIASSSNATRTTTGPVTTVTASLVCVGQPAAQGNCFSGLPTTTLSALRIGDCVRVTYGSSSASGPTRARTLATARGRCTE